jgi:5-methylcytosine-specific restriction endonuclease McrA
MKQSAHRGKDNASWTGGLPKCRVCGKQQTVHHSPRCRKCALKDPVVIEKYRQGTLRARPNYKGGITPLTHTIRELSESRQWIKDVLAKSNYKCAECGAKGYLEAHHIIQFSILFQEFLQTYNQFSPIEDKETLARLATSYEPFFDVSNGKALCLKCHKRPGRDNRKTPARFVQQWDNLTETPKSFASQEP